MKRMLFITVICAFIASPAMADMTIDGVKSTGEWDSAQVLQSITGRTVSAYANTSYLYMLYELDDTSDPRIGGAGNDQVSVNINPTNGGYYGFPYDLVYQQAQGPVQGGTNAGPIDGWSYAWFGTNVGSGGPWASSLPSDLLSATLYGSSRVTELQVPLATIAPSVGDILYVGGNTAINTSNSRFPPGLNWSDKSTYSQVTVVPVPGAVLLGILGLSAAGIKLRKSA